YRVNGKSRKMTLGTLLVGKAHEDADGHLPALSVSEARQRASAAAVRVQRGGDPVFEKRWKRARADNTVNAVLDSYVADHVARLRSGDQAVRVFNVYVRPQIGGKSIYDLKRSDVTSLLSHVKERHGAVMADQTLAHLRAAFNWQMVRDD